MFKSKKWGHKLKKFFSLVEKKHFFKSKKLLISEKIEETF